MFDLQLGFILTKFETDPITWSIEDVGTWLQSINFPEYKRIFMENFISGYELLDLSEEDLIMMGISILGHRKRILKALSKISNNPSGDFDTRSVGSSESDSSDVSRGSSVSSHSSVSSSSSSKSKGQQNAGKVVSLRRCSHDLTPRIIR